MPRLFDDPPRLPGHHLVTVFEAVNETLHEVYVGETSHLIDTLIRKFRSSPPEAASHWKREHRVLFRCIEYSVAVQDASRFIDGYASSDALKGWTVLRE